MFQTKKICTDEKSNGTNKVPSTKINSNHQPQITNLQNNNDGASTNESDKSHPVHKHQIHIQ